MTHHRVTPMGLAMGRNSARLAELGRMRLEAVGLARVNLPAVRDEMCKTCACQPGKVPNGCLQTQLDFLKCVVDGNRFFCHSPKDGRLCAGWVRARAEHVANPLPPEALELLARWEYSPPDSEAA